MECSIYASYSGEPGLTRSGWSNRVMTKMSAKEPTIAAKVSQSRNFMTRPVPPPGEHAVCSATTSCQKAHREESRKIGPRPFEIREVDMQFPRRLMTAVTVALVALSWLTAAGTRADDFPSRVIRVVVAFPAGGPTDFVARILADRLKPLLGQNVIVENRPGANGAIGAEYVAKGEADGPLLFLTTVGAVAVTPHLSKPNYDTLRDFASITLVARPTTILVVRPDTPVNSAKELAALAREKPATIPFASTGSGSVTHLARALSIRGQREIPARAVSRSGAGLDRSARRPGAGHVRGYSGAAAAYPRRQAQADPRGLRRAQSSA